MLVTANADQGRFHLADPLPNTFPRFQIPRGTYNVRWLVQYFSVEYKLAEDIAAVDQKRNEIQAWALAQPLGVDHNPFSFPVWPGELVPSYPGPPTLIFSVGYKRWLAPLASQAVDSSLGHMSMADQILRATWEMPNTRLDRAVGNPEFFKMANKGWFYLECRDDDGNERAFDVIEGEEPVFVVCNIDDGSWKGRFRFGGVDMIKV